MRLLVDTTYLLPAIGVAIKGISEQIVLDLRKKDHSLSICTISLFELAANGVKYVVEGKLKAEQVLRGTKAVAADDTVTKVAYEDANVLSSAINLRREIADFIDCLILSAAVIYCDVLMTEDVDIRRSANKERIRTIIREIKPDFKILSSRELF